MPDLCWNDRRYQGEFYRILGEMILGMTDAEQADSLSQRFIFQMIPHHEAAIQMSQNLLERSDCRALEQIARNIITEQTQSICNMRQVLPVCSRPVNDSRELAQYERRFLAITRRMFCQMGSTPVSECVAVNFMRQMIPHHEGAIRMSANLLRFPVCKELVPIVRAIQVSQERGVKQMRRLLQSIQRNGAIKA